MKAIIKEEKGAYIIRLVTDEEQTIDAIVVDEISVETGSFRFWFKLQIDWLKRGEQECSTN